MIIGLTPKYFTIDVKYIDVSKKSLEERVAIKKRQTEMYKAIKPHLGHNQFKTKDEAMKVFRKIPHRDECEIIEASGLIW